MARSVSTRSSTRLPLPAVPVGSLPVLSLAFAFALAFAFLTVVVTANTFSLPSSFLGSWIGEPTHAVFGPLAVPSYIFSVSQSALGDYLLEVNLVYDSHEVTGWQRFYIEGYGETAGVLWYCGALGNFSDGLELTQHSFLPVSPQGLGAALTDQQQQQVTFCLDLTPTHNSMLAFPLNCNSCGCANWTMSYDTERKVLTSQLVMGADNNGGSQHLRVELKRIGDPPLVDDKDMPGHGANFTCAFESGGRDSVPVDRSIADVQKRLGIRGCPHMHMRAELPKKLNQQLANSSGLIEFSNHRQDDKTYIAADKPKFESANLKGILNFTNYTHCYVLNKHSDYRLRWSLDRSHTLIHVQVSATAVDNNTWIALGFRPLSRSFEQRLTAMGTGRHMNFGMEGADIVVGSVKGGVRSLYAKEYVGAPVPDTSLPLLYSSVTAVSSRVVLSFGRAVTGGYLQAHFGVNATILSGFSDVLWAVGEDSASGDHSCGYHQNTRGMRPVDWEEPEIALLDEWKC